MGRGMGEHGGKPPYPDTRMVRQRDLSARHAPPQTSLSDGACSPAPAESRTRMDEWWSLPVPHPIDRKAGLAISARTVVSRFAREDMLSHRLPATFILEWQSSGTCQSDMRRRKPACQTAHTFPLRRKAALEWMNGGICQCRIRLLEWRGLLFPLAPPKTIIPESISRPNGRILKPVSPAYDAGNHFARKYRLFQPLLFAHTLFPHYSIIK